MGMRRFASFYARRHPRDMGTTLIESFPDALRDSRQSVGLDPEPSEERCDIVIGRCLKLMSCVPYRRPNR